MNHLYGFTLPPALRNEQDDVVNELLIAASSALGRKRGNNVLALHRYVIRGSKHHKIGMEEATWAEYIAALCMMSEDTQLPMERTFTQTHTSTCYHGYQLVMAHMPTVV